MSNQQKVVLLGNEQIGEVSAYSALPAVLCPKCGTKLHRVFNTQTQWKYICMNEKILVTPDSDETPVQVQIE